MLVLKISSLIFRLDTVIYCYGHYMSMHTPFMRQGTSSGNFTAPNI